MIVRVLPKVVTCAVAFFIASCLLVAPAAHAVPPMFSVSGSAETTSPPSASVPYMLKEVEGGVMLEVMVDDLVNRADIENLFLAVSPNAVDSLLLDAVDCIDRGTATTPFQETDWVAATAPETAISTAPPFTVLTAGSDPLCQDFAYNLRLSVGAGPISDDDDSSSEDAPLNYCDEDDDSSSSDDDDSSSDDDDSSSADNDDSSNDDDSSSSDDDSSSNDHDSFSEANCIPRGSNDDDDSSSDDDDDSSSSDDDDSSSDDDDSSSSDDDDSSSEEPLPGAIKDVAALRLLIRGATLFDIFAVALELERVGSSADSAVVCAPLESENEQPFPD